MIGPRAPVWSRTTLATEGQLTDPSADMGLIASPALDAATLRDLLDDTDAVLWTAAGSSLERRTPSAAAAGRFSRSIPAWPAHATWASSVHPDDLPWVRRRLQESAAELRPCQIEYRIRDAEGEERWVRDQMRFSRDPAGGVRVHGLSFDVTEQQRTAAALREQRDLADAILDASEMLIVLVDPGGAIHRANRACERLLGIRAHRLVGSRFQERFASAEDRALAGMLLRRANAGETLAPVEIRADSDRGERARIAWMLAPLRDADGRLVRWVASGLDVTERAASEERLQRRAAALRQAQKMEAIGRMASGVSHEFNNLLTALLGFTQALESEAEGDARLEPLATGLRETLEHATSLTAQLRSMGQSAPAALRSIDLAGEVGSRVPLMRRLLGERIRIHLDLSGAGARVLGDPGQLQQILLNLLINARDAMCGEGDITVRVSRPEGGASVELEVCDPGCGMDEETRARIFDPYFTTKGDTGTGLGLTTVHAIVSQWGGQVVADSHPGRGTRMRLRWPEVEAGPLRVDPAPAEPAASRSARILLAEDEPRVRRMVADALRRDGHEVIAAADGREALELASARACSVDLLVTDVVMPRMTGPELARALRQVQPGVRVLYMSGYSDDAVLDHGVMTGAAEFLQKPFPPPLLLRRVSELLGVEERHSARD